MKNLFIIISLLLIFSCKKEEIIITENKPELEFFQEAVNVDINSDSTYTLELVAPLEDGQIVQLQIEQNNLQYNEDYIIDGDFEVNGEEYIALYPEVKDKKILVDFNFLSSHFNLAQNKYLNITIILRNDDYTIGTQDNIQLNIIDIHNFRLNITGTTDTFKHITWTSGFPNDVEILFDYNKSLSQEQVQNNIEWHMNHDPATLFQENDYDPEKHLSASLNDQGFYFFTTDERGTNFAQVNTDDTLYIAATIKNTGQVIRSNIVSVGFHDDLWKPTMQQDTMNICSAYQKVIVLHQIYDDNRYIGYNHKNGYYSYYFTDKTDTVQLTEFTFDQYQAELDLSSMNMIDGEQYYIFMKYKMSYRPFVVHGNNHTVIKYHDQCSDLMLNEPLVSGENEYRTFDFQGVTWMAENLHDETGDYLSVNNQIENDSIYGKIYTEASALNACPEGWRLPTGDEFMDLYNHLKENFRDLYRYPTYEDRSYFSYMYDTFDEEYTNRSSFYINIYLSNDGQSLLGGYVDQDNYTGRPIIPNLDPQTEYMNIRCVK